MGESCRKLLTWVGIIAVISLPILMLARLGRSERESAVREDENNIFEEELAEPA